MSAAMALLPAAKPWLPDLKRADGDQALQKIRRNMDTFTTVYGHGVDNLPADASKSQELSGQPVANLRSQLRKAWPRAAHI